MTVGVAVQAMLVGMPVPHTLHRSEVDGQVVIAVGATVLFNYTVDDAGLRNVAAVTLPEMGFTGRRVAQVLGITEEYVSMLRARARREGSAALTRRRGRPSALGSDDLARATVVACTPRRSAIAVSLCPATRQERARASSPAPNALGRPRLRISAAEPSRRARDRSIETYSSVIPSTSATRRPVKPISGSVTAA